MSWLISRGCFLVSIRINWSDYIHQFGTGNNNNTNYRAEVNRFRNHKKRIGWVLHSLWLTQPRKREKRRKKCICIIGCEGYVHTFSTHTLFSCSCWRLCFFRLLRFLQLVSSRWSIGFSLCTWTQNNECTYRSGQRFERFHVKMHAKNLQKWCRDFWFSFSFFFDKWTPRNRHISPSLRDPRQHGENRFGWQNNRVPSIYQSIKSNCECVRRRCEWPSGQFICFGWSHNAFHTSLDPN